MKMDEDHSVPLSDQALAILDKMRDSSQSELIFPSVGDEPFSNMAMLAVLDRLGYGHVTVHGFRATFATWAEECTDYPDGVREAALAHKYKNETVGRRLSTRSQAREAAQADGGLGGVLRPAPFARIHGRRIIHNERHPRCMNLWARAESPPRGAGRPAVGATLLAPRGERTIDGFDDFAALAEFPQSRFDSLGAQSTRRHKLDLISLF
jgi:hypothetical protein